MGYILLYICYILINNIINELNYTPSYKRCQTQMLSCCHVDKTIVINDRNSTDSCCGADLPPLCTCMMHTRSDAYRRRQLHSVRGIVSPHRESASYGTYSPLSANNTNVHKVRTAHLQLSIADRTVFATADVHSKVNSLN